MQRDIVTVEGFYKKYSERLGLKLLAGEQGLSRIIREPTVNRPGLALAGFTKYFAYKRIQVIGSAEASFLHSLSKQERQQKYTALLSYKLPCIVFCRSINPDSDLLQLSNQFKIPVFKSPLITMKFINLATLALEMMFAPKGIEYGSMVDILGVGVIIKGESGIGKSECVLALIERGYSLVADDITRVTLVDGTEIIGDCDEITRSHMEVRGIGIINVAAMFGVKSIRTQKRVDLVVTLKPWEEVEEIERLGLEQEYIKILGVDIPHITIPVRPGRDLARLVEVAAFQTKLRLAGYNSAKELDERILAKMSREKLK